MLLPTKVDQGASEDGPRAHRPARAPTIAHFLIKHGHFPIKHGRFSPGSAKGLVRMDGAGLLEAIGSRLAALAAEAAETGATATGLKFRHTSLNTSNPLLY